MKHLQAVYGHICTSSGFSELDGFLVWHGLALTGEGLLLIDGANAASWYGQGTQRRKFSLFKLFIILRHLKFPLWT